MATVALPTSDEPDLKSTKVYPVPVVYPNLRKPETYYQAFDALEHLDKVIEDCFAKISHRISFEKSRLQNLQGRLGNAQNQVQQIIGRTKATTIFSPNKYPAPPISSDYYPMFTEAPNVSLVKHTHYKLEETAHSLNNEPTVVPTEILTKEVSIADKNASKVGLGRLPVHLPSVSSLLLFNSSENPYQKYHDLDNLLGKDKNLKKDDGKSARKELTEAPKTFTEGDILPAIATINYAYRPEIGEVPAMELPSNLNLPNVAEVSWTISNVSSIAPSVPIPDLPAIEQTPADPVATTSAPPPPPPPSSAPPPPPPPPSTGPAPPPPPPPPSAPPPPQPTFDTADRSPPPSGDNARSSLLEDIRKGHMGRLKSAKKAKIKEKKKVDTGDGGSESPKDEKKKAPPSSTGDIFGDLLQALNRRRKGIAEKQDKGAREAEARDEITAPPSNPNDWD